MTNRTAKLGDKYNDLTYIEQIETHSTNGNWQQFRLLIEVLKDRHLLLLVTDNMLNMTAINKISDEILLRMKGL